MSQRREPGQRRRGLSLALFVCGLCWAAVAESIAVRAAAGLTTRLHVVVAGPFVAALCFLFLLILGLQVLAWVGSRTATHEQEPGSESAARGLMLLPTRLGWQGEWGLGLAFGWGLALVMVLPLLLSGHLHAYVQLHWTLAVPFVLTACTLLAVTLGEELVFRGYLFQQLIQAIGISSATTVSSFLFAFFLVWPAHRMWGLGLLNTWLLGLLLAMAVLRTEALWLPWGLHIGLRGSLLLLFGLSAGGQPAPATWVSCFASGSTWLTGGSFGVYGAAWTLPLLVIALPALFRLTRDYAWFYTFHAPAGAAYAVAVAPPKAHLAMEQSSAPPALVQILPTTPAGASVLPKTFGQSPGTE